MLGKTVVQTLKMLKNKEISSVELTQEYLKNIKNSDLNAFITVCEESAMNSAKKSDDNISKGEMKKLEGIPIGIKDVFCTDGIRTTSGSKMLENFVPNYNADVVQKVLDENAVNLGKLNMDEFAMGSTTANSYFGPTYNPIRSKSHPDWKLTPGGSSGGSSASVAGNLAMAAMGSDTGGSVRQPAAFCGLVGAKPTYGTCSRYGIIAYASSFDTPGFLGKDVTDVAYLMEIIAGYSDRDSMMDKKFKADFLTNINDSIKGMKIGIPLQFSKNIPDYISEKLELARKLLEKAGAIVDFVNICHIEKSINVYYIITPAEMCSNLGKFTGIIYGSNTTSDVKNIDEYYIKTRSENFGDEVKKRIIIGNYVLASGHYEDHYEKALKVRRLIKNEFDKVFENHDAILCPTALNVAFDVVNQPQDPITTYMNDISTAPANIAGLPAISVPFGENSDGLPIGMQIMTNRFEDKKMYQIARNFEMLLS